MVGKRQRPGLISNGTNASDKTGDSDLENGSAAAHDIGVRRRVAPKFGFRDAVNYEIAQQRRDSLKKALLEGIKTDHLDDYRKSHTDLEKIKNKKVREFYERQNDKINDWAEVDTLVIELSDDVVDSFNPDADHDGIVERRGPLQRTAGDLESFLPEDERQKRKANAKKAKWAVNVSFMSAFCSRAQLFACLLIRKVLCITPALSFTNARLTTIAILDQRSCQCLDRHREDYRGIRYWISFSFGLTGRFCP